MTDKIQRRRRVLFFPGYEPLPAIAHYRRFVREAGRSAKAWGFTAEVADLSEDQCWTAALSGPNWRSEAQVELMAWDDLIAEDFSTPLPSALWRYGCAFADLVRSGTLARYFALRWPYGLFALYPAVLLALFATLAAIGGVFAARWVPVGGFWAGLASSIGVFVLLLVGGGRFVHLRYLLADWIFAKAFIDRSRPQVEARLDAFAARIVAQWRADDAEEIALVGYSLGAAFMQEALARAVRLLPSGEGSPRPLVVLGLGSSLLKVAVHPKAGWMRQGVAEVAQHPGIHWSEFDSQIDIIGFYKVPTLATLGIEQARPVSRVGIRISRMIETARWRRISWNFLAIHRHYVLGNDKRFFYDFFVYLLGPLPLRLLVEKSVDPCDSFAPDGALIASNMTEKH